MMGRIQCNRRQAIAGMGAVLMMSGTKRSNAAGNDIGSLLAR